MSAAGFTALPGFLIGQAEDRTAMTGCTAIIAPEGAVCGVDVRGGSPGTRDTDALDPTRNRKAVHAVLLTGGSSFGLAAADGLSSLLEERGIGRGVGVTVVPNVCAAVLFDLKCGRADVRPDARMGRLAGENAFAGVPFASGNYGAGTGATVGKSAGPARAMKGGVGAAVRRWGALAAGAVFAVNCVGDVCRDGHILAGARLPDDSGFAGSERLILERYADTKDLFSGGHTVLGCIMTNARLDKAQAAKLAALGQNAIARTVEPAHTVYDGDTVFALCSGDVAASLDAAGILAVHAAQAAIWDAVRSAETYDTFLSYRDWRAGHPSLSLF